MTQAALQRASPAVDPRLARYVEGDELDATDSFRLVDDRWLVTAYQPGAHTRTVRFLNFEDLASFIKPYVKWHVYESVLLAGRSVTLAVTNLVAFRYLDAQIVARCLSALEDLIATDVFVDLWGGLVDPWDGPPGTRPERTVHRQHVLRPFWRSMREAFGVPARVPRAHVTSRRPLTIIAADDERVIPPAVVRQLAERLAHHRDGVDALPPRDAMGLAILLLHITLGRRISEVLLAKRGEGGDGPLVSFEAADGAAALGFRFAPSKGGPGDLVYISPEWEDLVRYCVGLILAFSDEARPYARAEDQDLLILAWGGNGTRYRGPGPASNTKALERRKPAAGMSYIGFYHWLRGRPGAAGPLGAMARFGITSTGEPDAPTYVFKTHAARHTRQTALMADPAVSRLAAQRDLNTTSRDVQGIYQHGLARQNEQLLGRLQEGALIGAGATWLADVTTGFEPGHPRLIQVEPRIAALVAANPAFLEFNRVPAGYCVRPQGPAACPEFLACLEATDDGCSWFATDPGDPVLLGEIEARADERRVAAGEARLAGKVVLAGKLAVLADRAERLRDEALERASQEALIRLRSAVPPVAAEETA